jgi:hypothetical protein
MKKLLLLLLFVAPLTHAKNYYVSLSGNDSRSPAQAQNPATPWQSLAKLNRFFSSLQPGDSILLKRGDVFYGKLVPSRSGTSANPIVIGAYGEGAMPVITGFTTVQAWVPLGGGIWESAAAVSMLPACNIVTVDGRNTGMGRYPDAIAANDGYLKPDAVGNGTTITNAGMPSSAQLNFSGGEIVVRRSRFQLFRYKLTAHNGRTITYAPSYPFTTGMGYFVQNHPATVTGQGEWYYDAETGKLRMHFGTGNPANHIVKIASVDTLAFLYNLNYITLAGIALEGANDYAILGYSATANNIVGCSIRYAGRNAVRLGASRDCIVEENVIEDIANNGISVTIDKYYSGFIVRDNVLKRIGLLRGGGVEGDNKFNAIYVTGSRSYIERNRIDSVGYAGILFGSHDSIYMRHNLITHWCMTIDDGGAIYTAQHTARLKTLSDRVIEGNIMLWSGNPTAGTASSAGAANGVYIDDGANGVAILNNTVAFASLHAYYLHNAFNVTVRGNTAFGFPTAALRMTHNGNNATIRGIDIKHNIFVANEATASTNEAMVYAQTDATDPDFSVWGNMDSNWYASPADAAQAFKYRGPAFDKYISFADWKRKTVWDKHSTLLLRNMAARPDVLRFEYNATAATITISLDRKYMDAKGKVYSGTVTLQPYSSVVLFADESGRRRYKLSNN